MSEYEISRWAALIEAVELIEEKCEEKHIDFEKTELKPLDIMKYVDNVSDIIYNKNFPNKKIVVLSNHDEEVDFGLPNVKYL